jgi:hypothetical protein
MLREMEKRLAPFTRRHISRIQMSVPKAMAMRESALQSGPHNGSRAIDYKTGQTKWMHDTQTDWPGIFCSAARKAADSAPSKNTWDTVCENAVFCTKQVMKMASIFTGDIARTDYRVRLRQFHALVRRIPRG